MFDSPQVEQLVGASYAPSNTQQLEEITSPKQVILSEYEKCSGSGTSYSSFQ